MIFIVVENMYVNSPKQVLLTGGYLSEPFMFLTPTYIMVIHNNHGDVNLFFTMQGYLD